MKNSIKNTIKSTVKSTVKRGPPWVKRRFPLFGMLITGVGIGVLAAAFLLADEIYYYQDTFDGAKLPSVDAIVCLAGGRGRIAAAGDVWYRYWEASKITGENPPVLFISGMGHHSNWGVFTRQLRQGVLNIVQPENVVLEKESASTESNAIMFSSYARLKGWKRILLVTSRYHMRRAKLIFEVTLKSMKHPVEVETLSVYQEPFEPGEWRTEYHGIRVTLVEYIKWAYYRLTWRGSK
jgi:uncharacterized SAM-binding protein YcdF (DUF218 family)